MSRINNQKGLTLLELLAALAIFAVIGAIMFSLILNALNTFGGGMAQSRLVKESELIELKLKQVVRNSTHFDKLEGEIPSKFQFNSSSGLDNVIFEWNKPMLYVQQGASKVLLSENVSFFNLVREQRKINYFIKLDDGTQSIEVNGTGAVFIPSW